MAGGDNCARGLALGILLGSANGLSSIPEILDQKFGGPDGSW